MKNIILTALILIILSINLYSQDTKPDSTEVKTSLFKDPLDNKVDLSKWLMQAAGFVPLVQIVTEPSLGYFGGIAAPIFIQPNKPAREGGYAPPNLTVGMAGYTANNTWALGAMRIVHNQKLGLRYRYGAAYANINMDFYKDIPHLGEKKFSFNFRTIPFYGNILKEIGHTHLFAGVEYIFASTDVKPVVESEHLSEIIKDKDFNSTISTVGTILQYDHRDNIFTPNNGLYAELDFRMSDSWTGSDYDFRNMHIVIFKYFQPTQKWVSGYRFDGEFLFGNDAPFYVHPGINLRGVPMARYQGMQAYTVETEQRYDFTMRWSGVVFGGLAKAIDENSTFKDETLVYNYGVGFRYLISRLFGMRMGMDFGWSNNDFGYYITFGSAWKR
ncbi:MAG: glyceraldehyde-3-phosphate dehydrogenase [Bacteroidota bacterium]